MAPASGAHPTSSLFRKLEWAWLLVSMHKRSQLLCLQVFTKAHQPAQEERWHLQGHAPARKHQPCVWLSLSFEVLSSVTKTGACELHHFEGL